MNLFDSIKQFLMNNHFVKGTNEREEIIFTREFTVPGKIVVINGQRMDTPAETRGFIITYLGQGEMCDTHQELHGFNMANNDIWVDSFEDFKFWISKIFTPKPKQYDN